MPWEMEYEALGIPKTLAPYPDKPVFDMLAQAAERFTSTGFIQKNRLYAYPEIKDHADRLATALADMGLEKGDRVATVLPTCIQYAVADYAVSTAGLVHMPSSFLEPEQNLAHKFDKASPKAVITTDEHLDLSRKLARDAGVAHVIVSALDDYSENPPAARKATRARGVVWLADLLEQYPADPPRVVLDPANDLETLIFTGGTTGLPKGCMVPHRQVYTNTLQCLDGLGRFGRVALEGAISVLLGIPFYHSYGHAAMHLFTLLGANQILVTDPRDTGAMVRMIKEYRPVAQMGVPTQFLNLAREELGNTGILGVSGSAPLPASTHAAYEEQSSGSLIEGYGLSEMGPVVFMNLSLIFRMAGGRDRVRLGRSILSAPGFAPLANRVLRALGPKTVGRALSLVVARKVRKTARDESRRSLEKRGAIGIPIPDTDIMMLDVNTGAELTREQVIDGERGELCIKGPHAMLGYWPEPGSGKDRDGYIHTGDVMVMDAQGYFTIVDRVKDMIIVSGYKVYSRELEDVLYQHPGVAMAAVIGVPDPEREGSERPVAYVVPNPAYDLSGGDVVDFMKERVAKYAVPKVVRVVDEIPLTAIQKVDKKALRKMAEKDFAEAE